MLYDLLFGNASGVRRASVRRRARWGGGDFTSSRWKTGECCPACIVRWR